MVFSKSKSNKKETKSSEKNVVSQSVVTSGEVKGSNSQGGGGRNVETYSVTNQLPMMQERMVQKASSSSVAKSSSSTQVASSSQEQKFYSSTSSSNSKAMQSGKTQQLQSQTNDFLRGERILADIDDRRANNGSILIESVDLQNVSSSSGIDSGLNNLVSVEIESKDSYAQHKSSSKNEFVTTTHSTYSSSNDQNRNDVIAVESGKSKGKTSTVAASGSGDVRDEKISFIQGPNVTSSSSSKFEEFSSSSMATSSTNNNETKAASSNNTSSSRMEKNSDGKNIADTTTTFTSKVYDDKSKTWVVVEQSSVNETDIILPGAINSHTTQKTSTKTSGIDSAMALNDNLNTTTYLSDVNSKNTKFDSSTSNIRNVMKSSDIIQMDSSISNNNSNIMSANSNTMTSSDIINMNSSSSNNNFMTSSDVIKMDSSSSNSSNVMKSSDVLKSSKSSKEVLEKNMSSKKQSSRDEKTVTTTSNETIQVFDSKTKSWINVDANSFERQKRPSYVRYRSQDEEGKWHTIYKRKLYDEFSKQWRIVDEKIFSGDEANSKLVGIPEMIENSANITTTTYTTKVYDTKTGKWTIVEEKSYVDSEPVNVTQDIKREIEKDQPDIANVITTTETTKVSIACF